MAPRHTKHAFPFKFVYLFHSKNTLFNLFIFLIGLSIGFVCAFYLQNISILVQSSVFSVFHSLSLLPLPSLNTSISSTSPPVPTSSLADSLSSLTLQTPPPQPSSLPTPPLSLPHGDILSPSSLPPLPSPLADSLVSLTLQTQVSLSAPISSPPPPPISLPHGDTLSPSSALPPLSPPLPLPPADSFSSLTVPHQVILLAPNGSPLPQPSSLPPSPLSVPDGVSPSSLQPLPSSTAGVSLHERIPMMHNMSDDDLVARVMEISTLSVTNYNAPYKVAFMFLTPGQLPLLPLWELFFKGNEGLFSIYLHPHPSYNDTIPQDSVLYGTRITSQPVYWGDISMVDAERRLLANALLEPLNQRFVLLSDSCIPLFNFTTIYNYLINSNQSYISSFDDKRKSGRGRYNPQMSPNITIQDWRKGSQWFEVGRDLALGIVGEQKYYSIFKEYCHPPCYNDEHYLPTFVNILYGKMNSNRSITHVDWSIAGPHPRKYVHNQITEELLDSIRFGSAECVYNDNTTPMCVLFARKFTPGTLKPLLTFAPLLYGSSS